MKKIRCIIETVLAILCFAFFLADAAGIAI